MIVKLVTISASSGRVYPPGLLIHSAGIPTCSVLAQQSQKSYRLDETSFPIPGRRIARTVPAPLSDAGLVILPVPSDLIVPDAREAKSLLNQWLRLKLKKPGESKPEVDF